MVNCPFIIRYNKIDFKVKHKRPGSLYKVRVTKVIAKHTCLMSNSAYRVAKQTSHSSNIDLTEVSTAVNYLKIDPHLKAKELRNLLKDCLPSYFVIDSMFLNNFRRRVAIHHAKNPDGSQLTHDVATRLTKRCNLKQNEIEELEDPFVRNNFRAMYKQIMSESSSTWQVINYLQQCTVEIKGFDYRIQKSTDGRPIAIMWMTPTMRTNLLRYSHILFLDCQKRQMNKIAWPYMGPSVLN